MAIEKPKGQRGRVDEVSAVLKERESNECEKTACLLGFTGCKFGLKLKVIVD